MSSIKRSICDTTDIHTKRAKFDTVYQRSLARMNNEDTKNHKESMQCVMTQLTCMNLYQPVENVVQTITHTTVYDLPKKRMFTVLQRTLSGDTPWHFDVRFQTTLQTRDTMNYVRFLYSSCYAPLKMYNPVKPIAYKL